MLRHNKCKKCSKTWEHTKLAVDIERNILAGGSTLHADCEAALLEDEQANI